MTTVKVDSVEKLIEIFGQPNEKNWLSEKNILDLVTDEQQLRVGIVRVNPFQCAYWIDGSDGRSGNYGEPNRQCSRKFGYGPNQNYCKQHAKQYTRTP